MTNNPWLGMGWKEAWQTSQQGWTCPKCGRVWAPFVPSCAPCNNPPQVTTTDKTEKQ
jgi:uncharacterized OB-fold protein